MDYTIVGGAVKLASRLDHGAPEHDARVPRLRPEHPHHGARDRCRFQSGCTGDGDRCRRHDPGGEQLGKDAGSPNGGHPRLNDASGRTTQPLHRTNVSRDAYRRRRAAAGARQYSGHTPCWSTRPDERLVPARDGHVAAASFWWATSRDGPTRPGPRRRSSVGRGTDGGETAAGEKYAELMASSHRVSRPFSMNDRSMPASGIVNVPRDVVRMQDNVSCRAFGSSAQPPELRLSTGCIPASAPLRLYWLGLSRSAGFTIVPLSIQMYRPRGT